QTAGAGSHRLAGANQWIGTTFCTGNGRKADHALRLKPDHFIGIPPAGAVCPDLLNGFKHMPYVIR
ncbi:hypothetical protein, partial [Pelagibacterium sediminicola]|uniref:hypothetical protein n=1 Tax=Pelagibacterium sediminicola TaxID=2248761 RepID=UPI001AECCCD8